MSSTSQKTEQSRSRLNTSMSHPMPYILDHTARASRRSRRLSSISLISLLAFGCFSAAQAGSAGSNAGVGRIQAFAAPSFLGAGPGIGSRSNPGAETAQALPVGANTESSPRDTESDNWGFNISVDGERLVGDTTVEDWQRRTDVDLASADIQVKFDGLGVKPILNVSTKDVRQSYRSGERIEFVSTTNYPAWIAKAEVRIHDAKLTPASRPSQVINIEASRENVSWRMPNDGPTEYTYVLRVYDAKGRFDETEPLILRRTSKRYKKHETSPQQEAISAGEGEDRTAVRNIPVYGGAITVFGRDVPAGFHVDALGESVPVDANGSFVVQRILPPGEHSVDVSVNGKRHGQLKFVREVNIPENEWFYVGLADLTVGKRSGSKHLVAAAPGEFKSIYDKGRLAFYLKGKIKGRYLLTAAADTGEGKVRNLFKNFDDKSPAELIRRIDPNKFYPVYGDDSTAIEDAPTDGKFYVKLQRGNSHVMWGRFKTSIKGTEFARNERKLYGGHAVYRSEAATAHGAPRVEAEAYASKPNTLPQRDNMRGTGGSVYFLSRQDVNRNSETLTIEVRDNISGFVLKRHTLRYGEDYDINYVQGVVILKKPLASSAGSGTFITDGGLDGHSQVLVAQYEYTPGIGNVKGYSSGGRFQTWVTSNVRVGVSGMNEETGTADQVVLGGDLHVRLGANSYAEVETSRSEGPGFGNSNSLNGGLTITANNTAGTRNREAWAHRTKAHVDLEEMGTGMKGHIASYYEWRGKGYSSIAHNTPNTQHTYGVEAKIEAREDLRYLVKYRDYHDSTGQEKRVGDGQIEYDWDKLHTISFGLKHTDVQSGQFSTSDGGRTDIGVKFSYKPDENHEAYVFGQVTINNTGNLDRNDRIGVGGKRLITEKVGIKGEVSYGTLGWGGLAGVTYDPTADDHYYFGYKLDPDRQVNSSTSLNGHDHGGVVLGAKQKVSDQLAAFAENNYDMFGHRQSLTSTYGVVYTPTARWIVNGGIEYGEVKDRNSDNLDRIALSASVTYKEPEKMSWRLKGEARFEESQNTAQDRDTFLVSAGTKIKHNENWRFLAGFDGAISRSNQADFLDGDYLKGSVGYAYRGTDRDDVTALFKYIFLYDLPGPDQVNAQGLTLGPAQRSHIISADVSFDVSKYVTIGAKYGARFGETSQDRSRNNFVKSSAHLGVIRADLHIVKQWDAMIEARILHTPEIDTTKTALLAGVYRHLGNNLKFGVGYNFGEFSDDVADLTHDEHGVFVNLIGKF